MRNTGGRSEHRALIRNLLSIQRGMQIGASEEITRLERNVPWLAITAAVSPFVGLFGTVWGIIDAFQGLGTAGAATLRAVAPGISEALITTAAGLAAAIPAVIAYNLIGASIRELRGAQRRLRSRSSQCGGAQPGAGCGPGRGREALMAFTASNGTHTDCAGRHQHHSAGGRGAGAVDHLHGHGAGAAVGNRRQCAEDADGERDHRRAAGNHDQQRSACLFGQRRRSISMRSRAKLKQKIRDPRNQFIFVRADENVPFGAFATVMDAVKQAGITNVSIVTQPLEQNGSKR